MGKVFAGFSAVFHDFERNYSNSEEKLILKDIKSTTIKNVLNVLAERYGKDFVEYVYDPENGQVKGFLQFLVDGRSAATSRGLSTRLADGRAR